MRYPLLACWLGLCLVGCHDDNDNPITTPPTSNQPDNAIYIDAGPELTERIQEAFINADNDAVIVLPEGRHTLTHTLLFDGDVDGDGAFVQNITIKGMGQEKTQLDFSQAESGDGIFVQNARNIQITDLSVLEAKNNGIKLKNTNGIILDRVSAIWEGEVGPDNGAYGLYPVECQNILIQNSYVRGSADAGIYVGQSEYIVVRNSIAELNVAGIEIENSRFADVYQNTVFDNTGGVLVFDLPIGNHKYGSSVRVFDNHIYRNNTHNFANASSNPAGVHIVPPGTGVILLATSEVEVFNNRIEDHDSLAVAISSFHIAEPDIIQFVSHYAQPGQAISDGWRATPRAIYVHDNQIQNTGAAPNGKLIKDIITAYQGAHQAFPHILYDGLGETLANTGAAMTLGLKEQAFAADGSDNVCVNNSTQASIGQLYHQTPEAPSLQYEARQGQLLKCELTALPVHTVTFNGQQHGCGVDDDYDCDIDVVVANEGDLGQVSGGIAGDGDLSLCTSNTSGVNWSALLGANCPNLSDYGLLDGAPDSPRAPGIVYTLNTPLFTDHTNKHRLVFIPPGQSSDYREREVFDFPVGSVLVKTFTLASDTQISDLNNEAWIETRLLIHREAGWAALPYVWDRQKSDAHLAKAGAYQAHNTKHLGEDLSFNYKVPNQAECKQCHQQETTEGVFAITPIGPKARHLSSARDDKPEQNQLEYWQQLGLLQGLPNDITSIDAQPRWSETLALSSLSDVQVHKLAKGYLDINCAHCHRPEGNASNTGLKLEYWRDFEQEQYAHGVCKQPVAYGGGSLGYDIVPGDALNSILYFRMQSNAAGDRMPEIGRAISHSGANALIAEWINRMPAQGCN